MRKAAEGGLGAVVTGPRWHRLGWALLLFFSYAALALYRCKMTIGAFRNSDDSGNFLAGVEMAEGNWNLSGWNMAPDNYYCSDVLGQALLRAVFGVHPIFMMFWEGLVWGGVAWAGTLLACAGRPRRHWPGITWLALAALAFNIFDHAFGDVFLSSIASHGCTILLSLLALGLAGTGDPRGMKRALALGVVVTLGCFSDPIFVVIACLPILAVLGLRLGPAPFAWARPLATVGGFILARLLVAWVAWTGGFQSAHLSVALAGFPEFLGHLPFAAQSVFRLLGVGFFGRSLDEPAASGPLIGLARTPLALAFLAMLAEATPPLWRRIRTWPTGLPTEPGAELEAMLWFSTVACIASVCVTTVIQDQSCTRFFLPACVTGSVLTARRLGGYRLPALYGGLVLLASALIGLLALPPHQTTRSTVVIPQVRDLASALREHRLTHGYAGYWEGTIVTALTRREITSLPLAEEPDGHLHPFRWLTNLHWYEQAARDWHGRVFFVSARPAGGMELSDAAGRQQFGTPRERYDLGQFVIEVFDTADPRYTAPAA